MFSILLFGVLLANELTLVPAGSMGGEDFFLGAGTAVAADDSGRVFVLDPAAYQVLVLDADLNEVRRFGQKGEGPGEFKEPKTIALTPTGQPAVFDPTLKRMTVFETNGTVADTVLLDPSSVAIYHPVVTHEGNIAFLSARAHEGKPVYDLNVYGRDASIRSNVVRIPVKPLDWSKSSNPSFWVEFLRNEFELLGEGLPVAGAIDSRTWVYARSNQYQLHFVSNDVGPVETVTHEYKPVPLTESTKMAAFEAIWDRLTVDPFLFNNMRRPVFKRAASQAEAPPALPVIKAITKFGEGFAVLAQYDDHKKRGRFDTFNRKGMFMGSAAYLGPANFVAGNRDSLFTVGDDDAGNVVVRRWRLE